MIQEISFNVDIPEGYEFVRYGVPGIGELSLLHGTVETNGCLSITERVIVKRSEPKRWIPKPGQRFFIINGISDLKISEFVRANLSCGDDIYKNGIYFQTREQAKECLMKLVEAL